MATTITTSQTASTLPQKKGDPPNFGTVKSGRALAFDGVVDYLETPSIHSFDEKSSITITCWVYINSAPSGIAYLVSLPETVIGSRGVDIQVDADEIIFSIYTHSDSSTSDIKYTFNTGVWYRVVLTYDGTDLKGYINGSLVGANSVTVGSGIKHASSSLYIGQFSSSAGTIYLDSNLSDVQVWDAAWTLTDVQNDYRHPEMLAHTLSGTSLTESNLKIWYPMTEGNPESPQTTIFDGSPKVLGSELVVNGGFDTDTDWTKAGEWSIDTVNGVAKGNGTEGNLTQTDILVSGKYYKATYTIKDYVSGSVRVELSDDNSKGITRSSNGTFTEIFKANNDFVRFDARTAFTGSIDDVSVKEVQRGNHATSVFYGDELITVTGDKNLDAGNNWDVSAISWQSVSGNLRFSGIGTGTTSLDEAYPSFVAGKTYEIRFSNINTDNDTTITWKDGDGSNTLISEATYSNGTKYPTFVAPATTTGLTIAPASGSGAFDIDWINVKEVGLSTTGHVEGQETIFQPAFVGQSRKKVFGDKGTWVNFSQINDIDDGKSISFWMCPNKFIQNMMVLGANDTASNIVIHSATVIRMEADASGHYIDWTVPTMSVGNWYHCVVVFNGDDGYSLYLNGSFVSTQDLDTFGTGGVDWDQIGGDNGSSVNFHGILDEISYWTKELTQSDVIEMYNDGVPLDLLTHSSTSDLVNYWRNNNLNTGGYWKDLKGSSHGTFNKTIDYEIVLPEGTTSGRDINGFFLTHPNKNYLSLDGGAHIRIPDSPALQLSNGSFSVEFWLKRHHLDYTIWIISKYDSAQNYWYITLTKNNDLTFKSEIGNVENQIACQIDDDDSGNFNWGDIGVWHHYVFTAERETADPSSKLIWYIDGVAFDGTYELRTNTTTSIDVDGAIGIGSQSPDSISAYPPDDMSVDDIRIYKKVLTPAEVLKNYRHGKAKHKD